MSALGSGLTLIAAPLYVAAHTRSPLIVSATTGVAWLPWLLFALPGGVLVDRVDRRRLMIAIDWVRAAAMGILATALLAGRAGIALLDGVLFVINAGEVVFRSASQAMTPAVVPRASLERANGWLVGGTTLMQGMIAGPLLAVLKAKGQTLSRRMVACATSAWNALTATCGGGGGGGGGAAAIEDVVGAAVGLVREGQHMAAVGQGGGAAVVQRPAEQLVERGGAGTDEAALGVGRAGGEAVGGAGVVADRADLGLDHLTPPGRCPVPDVRAPRAAGGGRGGQEREILQPVVEPAGLLDDGVAAVGELDDA